MSALAVAHRRANAVGPVRLTCHPGELEIHLLRVARFAPGFSPLAAGAPVTFRVPYRAVRGMSREGPFLHLALDPHAATPFNRFALVRFSDGAPDALVSVLRWRSAATALALLLAAGAAIAAALATPPSLVGDDRRRLALGAAVFAAVLATVRALALRWTYGGPRSDRLAASFERAVSARMGLLPADGLAPAEPPPPRPAHLLAGGARTYAFAALAVAAAVGASGLAVMVQRFGVRTTMAYSVTDARKGIGEVVGQLRQEATAEGHPDRAPCSCGRPDLGLWRDGFPEISMVITPLEGAFDRTWIGFDETIPVGGTGKESSVELDLAVVNNSSHDFDTIDLILTFARRDGAGRRQDLVERGLHWPRLLRPGQAVKWRVEATGTEVKAEGRYGGRWLGDDSPAADADAFYALRDARLPMVRLHAAVMLAWLGDPRALPLAKGLAGLSPAGKRVREELVAVLETPRPVCDLEPIDGGVELCIVNRTDTIHRHLELRGGSIIQPLDDLFLPGKGLRFELPLDVRELPPRFEVAVP